MLSGRGAADDVGGPRRQVEGVAPRLSAWTRVAPGGLQSYFAPVSQASPESTLARGDVSGGPHPERRRR
jgi:hypothetical protein